MKYVIGMVATQWVSLLANVGMMLTVAAFVANLVMVSIEKGQNDVNQMHSAWQGSLRIMAALFGVPVMLAGLGLIALGIFIVVKGKKYAAQAM